MPSHPKRADPEPAAASGHHGHAKPATALLTLGAIGVVYDATYFLGAESLNVTENAGMARWREQLFTVMSRNTTRAARFFNLPSSRTVEVGIQVDL